MLDTRQCIKVWSPFILILLFSTMIMGCGRVDTGEEICILPDTAVADRLVVNGEEMKEGTQVQAIELLRETIQDFDFGETQPNINLTEEEERAYLEGYMKILRSEIPILEYWNDEEVYYKELYMAGIPYWEYLEAKDKTEYPYGLYYYDWDGDDGPELGIYTGWLYIIKYQPGDAAGRILLEWGTDGNREIDYFGGFVGSGIWFHQTYGNRIEDAYMTLTAEGEWETWLEFEQGLDPIHPYCTITVPELSVEAGKYIWRRAWSERCNVKVGEETWKELTQDFYAATENLLQPKSLEELFGDILVETDPLFDNWDRNREYDYMDIYMNANMPYADEETYAAIKAAYNRIDFFGTYEPGDVSVYEEYKEKYWELLQSGGTLTDRETGEEILIADMMNPDGVSMSSGRAVTYALFDADGDTLPELAIYEHARAWYIIDYDTETEDFSLWFCKRYTYWYSLLGTKKVMAAGDWNYNFYQLDENGDTELAAEFVIHSIRQHTNVCLVGMPDYADSTKKDVLTEEMKQFGVRLDYSDGERWFFRVTESQFAELMEPYWEAYDERSWDTISLPYNEFFAEFIN